MPVFGTALAAATLGLAGLFCGGTATAGTPDDQFLAALHQQGIGFGDTQSASTSPATSATRSARAWSSARSASSWSVTTPASTG
jgi:hypothetical protein